eukprot:683254-Rhodomonas_salina.1
MSGGQRMTTAPLTTAPYPLYGPKRTNQPRLSTLINIQRCCSPCRAFIGSAVPAWFGFRIPIPEQCVMVHDAVDNLVAGTHISVERELDVAAMRGLMCEHTIYIGQPCNVKRVLESFAGAQYDPALQEVPCVIRMEHSLSNCSSDEDFTAQSSSCCSSGTAIPLCPPLPAAASGLLPNWEEAKLPDWHIYFWNKETSETMWDRPTKKPPPPPPPSAPPPAAPAAAAKQVMDLKVTPQSGRVSCDEQSTMLVSRMLSWKPYAELELEKSQALGQQQFKQYVVKANPKGSKGAQGSQSDKGDTGCKGYTVTGGKGDTGCKGYTGCKGGKGCKGDKVDTGSKKKCSRDAEEEEEPPKKGGREKQRSTCLPTITAVRGEAAKAVKEAASKKAAVVKAAAVPVCSIICHMVDKGDGEDD